MRPRDWLFNGFSTEDVSVRQNFTRRHKLDYESCDLRYKFAPSAFRFDLVKLIHESIELAEYGVVREYAIYRNLAVAINTDHAMFFGEDAIHEGYSGDFLVELITRAKWHEVLSIVEQLVSIKVANRKQINELFTYHRMGYEIVKNEDGAATVEVKYDVVIAELEESTAATEKYPVIASLIQAARAALVDPKNIDVETSVGNSVKALEAYLREWLDARGIKAVTLGDAVKEIRKKSLVPLNIVEALHQLYIIRNREPNVGHGSTATSDLTANDALLTCEMAVSFINYFHRLEGDTP